MAHQTWPRWVIRTYFGTEQQSIRDFGLGSVQSVDRDLVQVSEIRNGLVSQDGAVFKRGGSTYYTGVDGPDSGVRGLWAGQLTPGTRVVGWTSGHSFAMSASTPVTLSTLTPGKPARVSVIGGWGFIDGGYLYAGSLKTASYSTGTVSVTQGSGVVTGSGTTWTGNVDAGMIFAAGTQRYYVASVDSNTQITLNTASQIATTSGLSYSLSPVSQITAGIDPKGGLGFSAVPVKADVYAAVGSKLLLGIGSRVWQTSPPDDNGIPQPGVIPDANYVELPGGTTVTGIIGLRGNALVFGTQGLFLLTNVAVDIEDASGNPQQSLQQLSGELKLWGKEGLASWENRVIAPCIDDIYLIDGVSAPTPISRSITPKYRRYVQAGYVPGMASVFANHYVLPILNASTFAVVDTLVCRLDRPAQTKWGTFFPWSFMDGSGANVTSLAVLNQTSGTPAFLAGSGQSTSRVLQLSGTGGWFVMNGNATDHDGTVPALDVLSGDIPTGHFTSLVRFLRLVQYEATSTIPGPTVQAWTQTAVTHFNAPGPPTLTGWTQLPGAAPATLSGDEPAAYAWMVNRAGRYFRFRLRVTDPSNTMILRAVEIDILPKRH